MRSLSGAAPGPLDNAPPAPQIRPSEAVRRQERSISGAPSADYTLIASGQHTVQRFPNSTDADAAQGEASNCTLDGNSCTLLSYEYQPGFGELYDSGMGGRSSVLMLLYAMLYGCATSGDDTSPDNGVVQVIPHGYVHVVVRTASGSVVADSIYQPAVFTNAESQRFSDDAKVSFARMIVYFGHASASDNPLSLHIGGKEYTVTVLSREATGKARSIRLANSAGESVAEAILPSASARTASIVNYDHDRCVSRSELTFGPSMPNEMEAAPCELQLISIMGGAGACATGEAYPCILALIALAGSIDDFFLNCSGWLTQFLISHYNYCVSYPYACYGDGELLRAPNDGERTASSQTR